MWHWNTIFLMEVGALPDVGPKTDRFLPATACGKLPLPTPGNAQSGMCATAMEPSFSLEQKSPSEARWPRFKSPKLLANLYCISFYETTRTPPTSPQFSESFCSGILSAFSM